MRDDRISDALPPKAGRRLAAGIGIGGPLHRARSRIAVAGE
jgi:hypothetical protein